MTQFGNRLLRNKFIQEERTEPLGSVRGGKLFKDMKRDGSAGVSDDIGEAVVQGDFQVPPASFL